MLRNKINKIFKIFFISLAILLCISQIAIPVQDKEKKEDSKDKMNLYEDKALDIYSQNAQIALKSIEKRKLEIEREAHVMDLKEAELNLLKQEVDDKMKELSQMYNKIESALAFSDAKKEKEKKEEEKKKLEEIENQEKLKQAKKEEYKKKILKLVDLYSKMEPRKSAPIFEKMDIQVAKEIFENMKNTKAAKILAKLDSQKAAKICEYLADKKDKPAPPDSDGDDKKE